MPILSEPLNLDNVSVRELEEFLSDIETLKIYASTALKAQQARLAGRTEEARKLEAGNDRFYQSFPERLKW